MSHHRCLILSVGVLAGVLSWGARAAEGVIEINDAKIRANGGYPYVISSPGSYRLTSNLVQPDANTDVIRITSSNVSLDLNGFTLSGSTRCGISGAYPTQTISCSPSGTGNGISDPDKHVNVSVSNGVVTGMGASCVHLGTAQVARLRVSHCNDDGIYLDVGNDGGVRVDDSLVSDSSAHFVGRVGITLISGTLRNGVVANAVTGISVIKLGNIESSVATDNLGDGFFINRGTVSHSVSNYNQGSGIRVLSGGSLIGNVSSHNNGYGILSAVNANTIASQNLLDSNLADNTSGAVYASPAAGANRCSGYAC